MNWLSVNESKKISNKNPRRIEDGISWMTTNFGRNLEFRRHFTFVNLTTLRIFISSQSLVITGEGNDVSNYLKWKISINWVISCIISIGNFKYLIPLHKVYCYIQLMCNTLDLEKISDHLIEFQASLYLHNFIAAVQ